MAAAQAGFRIERRFLEPLQVPALDEKDVIDECADGAEPRAGLHFDIHRVGVFDEPPPPLVALFLRVAEELREFERHGYFSTSAGSTIVSGPRFIPLMPASIVLRSPTITTANLS